MKFLLFLMFVAVASATREEDVFRYYIVERIASIFNITKEESLECANKTGVTTADMTYLGDSINLRDSEITDMGSLKRASCTLVCAAQKQGTMVGREINLPKLLNYINEKDAPEKIQIMLRTVLRICKNEAENGPDECMVGFKFLKCMNKYGI